MLCQLQSFIFGNAVHFAAEAVGKNLYTGGKVKIYQCAYGIQINFAFKLKGVIITGTNLFSSYYKRFYWKYKFLIF